MRADEQDRSHVRRCAWCWFILVAAAVSGPIQAQEQPGSDVPSRSRDPIDLSADQIRTWEDAEGRWFLLTGSERVAVFQGIDEGLRAQQAVVRIKGPDGPGAGGYQAEVYAEGNVVAVGRRVRPVATLSKTLRSNRDARLKPYPKGAVVRLTRTAEGRADPWPCVPAHPGSDGRSAAPAGSDRPDLSPGHTRRDSTCGGAEPRAILAGGIAAAAIDGCSLRRPRDRCPAPRSRRRT